MPIKPFPFSDEEVLVALLIYNTEIDDDLRELINILDPNFHYQKCEDILLNIVRK